MKLPGWQRARQQPPSRPSTPAVPGYLTASSPCWFHPSIRAARRGGGPEAEIRSVMLFAWSVVVYTIACGALMWWNQQRVGVAIQYFDWRTRAVCAAHVLALTGLIAAACGLGLRPGRMHGAFLAAGILAVPSHRRVRPLDRPARSGCACRQADRLRLPASMRSCTRPTGSRFCAILSAVDSADFATMNEALRVADSVLSKHIPGPAQGRLRRRAHDHVRRASTDQRVSLTRTGRAAYAGHVAALQAIVRCRTSTPRPTMASASPC